MGRSVAAIGGHRRTTRRVIVTGVLLALFVSLPLALALARQGALGQVFSYCGVNVNSGTWCGNNSVRHKYDGQQNFVNAAPGGVCERMLNDNTGQVRYPGPTCGAYNSTGHTYCYTGSGGTDFLYQAEGSQRTAGKAVVSGNAYYGTLSPRLC